MKIVTNSQELPAGCAFIPTMGALHEGHGSLFAIGKTRAENVVASIFVNPLQFEKSEDLEKYPRTPDRDIDLAEKFGVTHLWLPTQKEIYPAGYKTLSAGNLGTIYEGASRPGHFDGVVTVVRRLLDLVKPKFAIFGEKDFQQLTLIRSIAGSVEIISAPTIRENDGLAMSSRNARLAPDEREAASIIYKALQSGKSLQGMREILASEPLFTLDYLEAIDDETFAAPTNMSVNVRVIVAGWINQVRLIDNMAVRIESLK
ncbi:MAG: pantoate--beta-alanine ligase [Actinobacteria bacterium]|uniref:pantoate--beta-alanine ligase (AMP-forming) n=1 Tax=freshwater metagenome TaxID=449393 RepID=A0A6J6HYS3_9ZZZZ|nr:pantoate--beta-alanine ligase [Actinomycetota bacterium]MTA21564.1 pantoate--beta-alanine ligase [Actinomycetota bacterium]